MVVLFFARVSVDFLHSSSKVLCFGLVTRTQCRYHKDALAVVSSGICLHYFRDDFLYLYCNLKDYEMKDQSLCSLQ